MGLLPLIIQSLHHSLHHKHRDLKHKNMSHWYHNLLLYNISINPCLDPAQLHVLLPIFVNDGNQSPNSDPINASRTHSMQTRLQSGAIEIRDYAAFYASLP